jgi:hypothetical protein
VRLAGELELLSPVGSALPKTAARIELALDPRDLELWPFSMPCAANVSNVSGAPTGGSSCSRWRERGRAVAARPTHERQRAVDRLEARLAHAQPLAELDVEVEERHVHLGVVELHRVQDSRSTGTGSPWRLGMPRAMANAFSSNATRLAADERRPRGPWMSECRAGTTSSSPIMISLFLPTVMRWPMTRRRRQKVQREILHLHRLRHALRREPRDLGDEVGHRDEERHRRARTPTASASPPTVLRTAFPMTPMMGRP